MSVGTRGGGAKHGQHFLDDLRTYCVIFAPRPTLATEIHQTKKAAYDPNCFGMNNTGKPFATCHSRLTRMGE
jgi:hypothetical protein